MTRHGRIAVMALTLPVLWAVLSQQAISQEQRLPDFRVQIWGEIFPPSSAAASPRTPTCAVNSSKGCRRFWSRRTPRPFWDGPGRWPAGCARFARRPDPVTFSRVMPVGSSGKRCRFGSTPPPAARWATTTRARCPCPSMARIRRVSRCRRCRRTFSRPCLRCRRTSSYRFAGRQTPCCWTRGPASSSIGWRSRSCADELEMETARFLRGFRQTVPCRVETTPPGTGPHRCRRFV